MDNKKAIENKKMLTAQLDKNKLQKGFTLIELLIVIGILGVLAAALLVALNPLEQFARGRDAGRLSSVEQLGKAMQSFYTAQGHYPVAGTDYTAPTWQTALTGTKDLSTKVVAPTGTIACTGGSNDSNYCYAISGTDAVIWGNAESQNASIKASGTTTGCGAKIAIYVYSTSQGKAGAECITSGTAPAATDVLN